ncbi:DUF6493 family protein [Plantactinospora sonchi]|uniref:DUF6493 family protein n=1 Tax=Plantactinospora sonchi TaxID=1544735 RepID=A0ABU7S2W4_9ACTN
MTGDLFELIHKGAVDDVRAVVTGLTEPQRRQLGGDLVAWVRKLRDNRWGGAEAAALAVAVVGCLPTAARAAEVLGRRAVSLPAEAGPPVVTVARHRGVDWLPELAHRLADRLPRDPWFSWSFIAHLVVAENAAAPTGDRFVEGWIASFAWPGYDQWALSLPDRLRADPFLDALVPRLFEIDGLGTRLTFRSTTGQEETTLPAALARLAAEGRLDRTALLGGCLDRLVRGDRPAALRAFVVLHNLLVPTPTERAARAADYLRLLADGPGPVATMAQQALRGLPDLELEGLLEAARSVLARPEKGLVRAQLGWLDQLARQRPDRAVEIAAVLAEGADHAAPELRDRAAALAARHGVTPTVVTALTGRGDELPPPPAPAAVPAPIDDPDELAEEVAVLLRDEFGTLALERVLEGVVRVAGADRHRLSRALTPVLDRHPDGRAAHGWDPCCLHGHLAGVLRSAVDAPEAGTLRARWSGLLAALRRADPPDPRVAPPHWLLRLRLAELGARLGNQRGGVALLATPTAANGSLDGTVLVDRVAALGDASPGRWDLLQALLRLPPVVDERLAGRAAALRTPAGDRLAGWLRGGGVPEPVCRTVTVPFHRFVGYHPGSSGGPTQRRVVELQPPRTPGAERFEDPLRLLTGRRARLDGHCSAWSVLWPAVLPGYRGLVAAYALPDIAGAADLDLRGGTAVLPLLAESTGRGGPALDLALAYGLGARHATDRVAALDALLLLAAAGDLDAEAVGRQVGELGVAGMLTLTRAVEPLRDAATAGAPLTVWRLLAAALPVLLAGSAPPRGTPDLLSLAAETATLTGVRIEVPGLGEVAARRGSSRLVTEARRLATAVDRVEVSGEGV